MILESNDLTDWVADREALLVAAWTPEICKTLGWDHVFAEALAGELHAGMVESMLKRGTEVNFVNLIARSRTGLDPKTEKMVAERFYNVTLKLAREASRHERYQRSAAAFPYLRGIVVGDARTNKGHLALAGIVLSSDHPFWKRWHPPFDMDCRCGTIAMTRRQFERSGLQLTSEAELAEREAQLSGRWPEAFQPLLDFRKR